MTWFDKLSIDCLHGDILSTDVEAIACNVNLQMHLCHSLGKQVADTFGPEIIVAIELARQTLPTGSLELGQAAFIPMETHPPMKGIIFFGWWAAENEFNRALIYRSMVNILRQGFLNSCLSLAIPLFGSGSGSMSFQIFQDTVAQVLEELNGLKHSASFSVEELYFVSTNSDRIDQLRQRLELLL